MGPNINGNGSTEIGSLVYCGELFEQLDPCIQFFCQHSFGPHRPHVLSGLLQQFLNRIAADAGNTRNPGPHINFSRQVRQIRRIHLTEAVVTIHRPFERIIKRKGLDGVCFLFRPVSVRLFFFDYLFFCNSIRGIHHKCRSRQHHCCQRHKNHPAPPRGTLLTSLSESHNSLQSF